MHHKVQDYAAWRTVFDELNALRQQHGATGARVYRNAADPTEIVALIDFQSEDNARQYCRSHSLREAMQRGGMVSQPEILFLEEV